MADPFAAALAALHSAAGSVAAVYSPVVGSPSNIRVIRHQPSDVMSIGSGHIMLDGSQFVIRRSDVTLPATGDTMTIGTEVLKVLAAPSLDAEGLSWTVQAA